VRVEPKTIGVAAETLKTIA